MNLIGHYTCAAVPSVGVRLGSVLPDLASLYHRRVRALALAKRWRASPELEPLPPGLLAGIEFHYAVDAQFHSSPLFDTVSGAIHRALAGASDAPGLKRFFPAHVLSELYLDYLLLRRDPGLADAFNRDLERGRELLTRFLSLHPLVDAAALHAFIGHVVETRFVDGYRSYESILDRMNRMLLRFEQRALLPEEQEAVVGVFVRSVEETEQALEAFLRDMHRLAPQAAAGVDAADWRAAAAQQWAAGALSPQFA